MYLFTINSTPKKDNIDSGPDVGGAYVNVWINFPDEPGAECLARYYIGDAGWLPGISTDVSWYSEESEVAEEDRQYFVTAPESGWCIVFHQYPASASDANVEYDIN